MIHKLADNNIPFQQSEWIRNHNPADVKLWEVPGAGHCGAVTVVPEEFDSSTAACLGGFLPTITLSRREKLCFKRVSSHAPQANEKQAPEFCGSGGQEGKGFAPVLGAIP
jgi:hypothetical protein